MSGMSTTMRRAKPELISTNTHVFNGGPASVLGDRADTYVVGRECDLSGARPDWLRLVVGRGYFTALPLGTPEVEEAKRRERRRRVRENLQATAIELANARPALVVKAADAAAHLAEVEAAARQLEAARREHKGAENAVSQNRLRAEEVAAQLAELGAA